MTIHEYVTELERRLPRSGRRRAIAEAEEHLRDSAASHVAAGLTATAAEEAAVRDFGPVETVARRLSSKGAIRETRIATALTLGAVAFFIFPLYVVPENTLPPAPWTEKPRDIFALQLGAISFWLAACVLAAAGWALAWTRWPRFSAPLSTAALGAIAGSILAAAALVERWFAAAPATPGWPLLAAPLAAACLAGCALAAVWVRRRRALLADPVSG
jgi:hypothetical protein